MIVKSGEKVIYKQGFIVSQCHCCQYYVFADTKPLKASCLWAVHVYVHDHVQLVSEHSILNAEGTSPYLQRRCRLDQDELIIF